MNYRLVILSALLLASLPSRAETVAELVEKALALACAEPSLAADAMAEALSPGALTARDESLTMGGQDFGWRRRFTLGDGGRLDITRLEPWGVLHRIEVQYAVLERPEIMVVAGADCVIKAARRLRYGADGRVDSIEILGPDLAPTGMREPLNPPVPPAPATSRIDPGGVIVALIDSGVNYLLPEINRRLARGGDGGLLGYDYWDMDDRPFDADPARSPFFPQRHGTRVASVILAEAPAARLIPYRYPRPDLARPAALAALVGNAASHGARIVSLAMASNQPEPWRAFAEAMAAHPDMLFVVSAGNDGRDLDRRPVYPAAFDADNMLVIAAADGFGEPAVGSNWGKGTVDLLVPGERVPVIDFLGRATVASGAGFAAPRITALAARLLERNPHWTAPELKAAIIARARLIDGVGSLTSRYGFLDLDELPR